MQFPVLADVLRNALDSEKNPLALVLAGHNGSGKSTLWYERLADDLRVPLINADRVIASILPSDLPDWAQKLRDTDHRWQRLSQEGIRAFKAIVMAERMPFAFETVFSHWVQRPMARWRASTKTSWRCSARATTSSCFL